MQPSAAAYPIIIISVFSRTFANFYCLHMLQIKVSQQTKPRLNFKQKVLSFSYSIDAVLRGNSYHGIVWKFIVDAC